LNLQTHVVLPGKIGSVMKAKVNHFISSSCAAAMTRHLGSTIICDSQLSDVCNVKILCVFKSCCSDIADNLAIRPSSSSALDLAWSGKY
jgi:hypothetical protein